MIVGVTGKKRHGKDRLVNQIRTELGCPCATTGMATHLKMVCAGLFNIPTECIVSESFKDKPFDEPVHLERYKEQLNEHFNIKIEEILPSAGTFREILQIIGTDVVRCYRPTYWVDHMERRYLSFTEHLPGGVFFIPDIRFDNEAALIRKHNGVLISVHRPAIHSDDMHASEQGITMKPDFHFTFLENDDRLLGLAAELVAQFILHK